jgi:hypothetical protein
MEVLSFEIIQADLKCEFTNCSRCKDNVTCEKILVDLNKNSPIL